MESQLSLLSSSSYTAVAAAPGEQGCCPQLQQPHSVGFPAAYGAPAQMCYGAQGCTCHGKKLPREGHHFADSLLPTPRYTTGCCACASVTRQQVAIPAMTKTGRREGFWCPRYNSAQSWCLTHSSILPLSPSILTLLT